MYNEVNKRQIETNYSFYVEDTLFRKEIKENFDLWYVGSSIVNVAFCLFVALCLHILLSNDIGYILSYVFVGLINVVLLGSDNNLFLVLARSQLNNLTKFDSYDKTC